MQIGGISHHTYFPPAGASLTPAGTTPGSPSETPAGGAQDTAQAQGVMGSATTQGRAPIDFTSATRQELFDWMNGEILAGRMSLHESTSFLGLTLQFDLATNKPVDIAGDTQRYDFTQRLGDGIEGAYWRHDRDAAARSEEALATILRYQEQYQQQASSIDVVV